MRHLPLFFLAAVSALAATLVLLGAPAAYTPAPAKLSLSPSTQIWQETVNDRTQYLRTSISAYPWAEQLRQRTDNDDDQEAGVPDRSGSPPSEPIFIRNPSGPVDCSQMPCAALTFDDGPVPHTREVLEALAEVDARASFFMTGQMAVNYPEIVAEVADAGHEVGNHGWSHTDFTDLSDGQLRSELDRTADAIEQAAGIRPGMARPPYGTLDSRVREVSGLPLIIWDTDSRDWQHKSAAKTRERVMDGVSPGDIVLLHDLERSTAEAVPLILQDLLAEGYHLVTVSEILGHPGEPGQVYRKGQSPGS
ncbi:polysaccharide deacetylase family protein [Nesterenkonia ebinurensis]|uniref:polysaccharide deacetylase family protein n=1 Tax=Nesterenkonia ebinurensis TaxID=2608252 RepID=UPI00168B3A34|nr:polysaccharide deacetylase family protein [Nesterenkonia ebinurensis]